MRAAPVAAPSSESDACLLLGDDEAITMLETGRFSGVRAWIDGDGGLITRFMDRLTSRASWLETRIRSAKGSR
jgi:hypothetical protein